jgi:peroxiredoxin
MPLSPARTIRLKKNMVLVESTMLSLGTKVPEFSLPDVVTGKTISLNDFSDNRMLLVMFICRHCPYVVHVQEELARIGMDYKDKEIDIVAISSNDPNYDSDDRPERLKEMAENLSFNFPYLFDETQEVAKVFTAACTPDFFLFDKNKQLVYRGQLDDSRPGSGQPVTGKDLREAIDAILSGKPVVEEQRPSTGCNIKWKT